MLILASRLDALNRIGRALADPSRARILLSLLEGSSYPAELAATLELTRSNVSNHLSCLRDCGLVVAEFEGRKVRYEIADPHLRVALEQLAEVTLAVNDSKPCIDEVCQDSNAPAASVGGGL